MKVIIKTHDLSRGNEYYSVEIKTPNKTYKLMKTPFRENAEALKITIEEFIKEHNIIELPLAYFKRKTKLSPLCTPTITK